MVDLLLQRAHLVHQLVGVVDSHLLGDLVESVELALDRRDALLDVAEHRLLLVQHRLLRQESDRVARREPGLTVGRLVEPRHDLEDAGLPGAVRTDDPDLRAGQERQGHLVENDLVAVRLARFVHGIDELWHRSSVGRRPSRPLQPAPAERSVRTDRRGAQRDRTAGDFACARQGGQVDRRTATRTRAPRRPTNSHPDPPSPSTDQPPPAPAVPVDRSAATRTCRPRRPISRHSRLRSAPTATRVLDPLDGRRTRPGRAVRLGSADDAGPKDRVEPAAQVAVLQSLRRVEPIGSRSMVLQVRRAGDGSPSGLRPGPCGRRRQRTAVSTGRA